MALTALIMACEPAGEGRDGLRATLPLLGGTLVEHQARQAAHLGAKQIVVLVARVPAALVAGLDRLRREGLRVDAARSLADAADRVHPDERVLLLGDGCLAETPMLGVLATSVAPALLSVADRPEHADLERIDAKARWAGAVLLQGRALRQVAAMLGDWDVQSTLLRAAVQAGATRIDAGGVGAATAPRILETPAQASEAERMLRRSSSTGAVDDRARWPRRFLLGPAARFLAGALAVRGLPDFWLAAGGALAAIMAIPLTWVAGRLLLPAMLLILASGLFSATAAAIAALRLAPASRLTGIDRVRRIAMAGALVVAALRAITGSAWGWWLLAALVPAALLAQAAAERVRAGRPGWILADADGLAWMFLLGWIVGGVAGGIGAAAAAALLSFAWCQASLARAASPGVEV